MAREFQVTLDSSDPGAHAAFWAEALHYVLQPPPDGFAGWDDALEAWGVPPERRNDRSALVDPDGAGPRLFFQRVASEGDARGARGMARSYDQAVLRTLPVVGLEGSRAEAERWYLKAAELEAQRR